MTNTDPTTSHDRPHLPSAVAPAALGAAGVYLGFAGLQVALAAGAPLGRHVWGGTQGPVLSTPMRVVAGGSAVALTTMAAVVTRRAGLVGRPAPWLGPATWTISGYMAVNTIGNLASASNVERRLFAPATAVAAGLTALVAHQTRGR